MPWYRGSTHFSRPGQVHPQLDPVEETAGSDEVLGRCLDVQDARAGSHPLRCPVGDLASSAGGVLVLLMIPSIM